MKSVAYWTAQDEPVRSSTFFYILQHPSREVAAANWKAFQDDVERKTVKAESEENGKARFVLVGESSNHLYSRYALSS